MALKYCCLYIVAFFCSIVSAMGQGEPSFVALTTRDGLSSNTISAITQDQSGLMWFGTVDGLNKFDGTNFTVYTHNDKDSSTIPTNEITSLLEDRSGILWVGTDNSGVAWYNEQSNSFVTIKLDTALSRTTQPTAKALHLDHEGNVWVGSFNSCYIINPKTKKLTTFKIAKYLPKPVNTLMVLSFFEDRHHRMWIGTNGGLLCYDAKNKIMQRFLHDPKTAGSISDNNVKTIVEDRTGALFFGTNRGLNKLMPDGKTFKTYRHDDNNLNSVSSDIIYSAIVAPDGKLWLGTENGLSIFDSKASVFHNIRPDRRASFSLSHKSVKNLFLAQRNIIWLGTHQGGINKYDPNLALFSLKRSFPFDPNGLSSPYVTAFAEYQNNRFFVGTDGGGLNLFNRKTGLFDHIAIKSKVDRSGSPLSILALELDRNKKLWIGTYQNGIFNYDPVTGKYRQYLVGDGSGLSQNDIFVIRQDSRGLIWIGTNGRGVDVFNPATNKMFNYGTQSQAGTANMPLNGFMRAIEEDKAGNIWLGSNGTGIAVFNPNSKKFTLYNKTNSGLSNNVVLSILHDRSGNTWVGTNGGGLNRFNSMKKKFSHLCENEGLANGIIHKILQDEAGLIWVSTDKGISSIDPATNKVKNYSKPNGVQDSPFMFSAGIVATDGELFFGGQDGFNYFKPAELPVNNYMPKLLLTDLKVGNKSVVAGKDAPVTEQVGVAKEINLDYGQNFSISYVALNYTAPQQNNYAYRLSGLDKEWNYVGKEKTAYYTNLDPGDYVFQVRASNNEGVWSKRISSIAVHIHPPWWRTPYAYTACGAFILSFLFYTRHRGIQKIKNRLAIEQEKLNAKRLIEQQRVEAERVHELDEQKIKFLTNLSHEFRTPISLIMAPADKLLTLPHQAVATAQIKMIRRNARRLLNLVNQLLDFRKMEEQELKLNKQTGDLVAFIKDAAEAFQDLSDKRRISLTISSEIDALMTEFDHDKIERIIFNILSNAFKFTAEGGAVSVSISLVTGDDNLPAGCRIVITDTGIGINRAHQARIFDRFFMENKPTQVLNQGSGIGLSIAREFVQLHGGEISVNSELNVGTSFLITLPLAEIQPQRPEQAPITENTFAAHNDSFNPVSDTSINLATVLLVEDNTEFRYYLKDSLQKYYNIVEAANGREGWQKALSTHPNLIVSDISMPYMDGIQLSQKLKADKRTSHIPVILLTAISGEEDQIKGLESGANDYLTKPFNFGILNTKIKNLLKYNRSLKDTYSKHIQVKGEEIAIESTDAKLLNNIVKYIDDKLNDPDLSVEELSRHVGMSRGSLYHKLLEMTGLSPVEYIRSVKLERAALLLEKSDYNVAQIAYMTGFGTPSYFSRLFKARYKVLPSEYINAKRKENKLHTENNNML
ncbi:response regulator [Mucilaginibacter roseus]|uniref:histidine kinase n=1 Tax=Mucilaginibacter roseus TaxID=1528868 RepID=A0ABS8TZN0_9SPHI|nr:hybrid sensor histidine kinase/response regulator transcription factor [Mucilaginibacter roseus]MCD8739265.1 response regulator [Mucilaginibacter roseus]